MNEALRGDFLLDIQMSGGVTDGASPATEAASAPQATSSDVPPPIGAENRLGPVEKVAVHVLSSAAVFVVLASALLVFNGGPDKKLDTGLWVVAFGIALPLGTFLGARQGYRLAAIPRPITHWALASGTALLMFGLVLLRLLHTGSAQLTVLGLLAVAAYGVTELAARRPAIFGGVEARPASAPIVVGVSAIVITIGMFLVTPGQTFPPFARVVVEVIEVLLLAGIVLAAVLVLDRRPPRSWRRRLLDVGLCVVLALVVFEVQLPPGDQGFVLHQDFYLGPLNDMAHGRTMLVQVFAQYGVGLYYALHAALSVLPLNHGGVVLLMSALMVAQYILVYATLRTAVRSQALVVAAMGAAVMGNIFANLGAYAGYPSVGPLRFGFPYLLVAAAVAAARWPRYARPLWVAQLAVIALAAVWSFETFVYTAITWFALVTLRAFGRPRAAVRVFVRDLAAAAAVVSVGAVLALTVGTRVMAGVWPDWGGYLAYLRLYSVGEFGNLPLDFWSPGLLMAAAIFLSAVGVISVARDERFPVSGPVLAGLAGFTGFAVSTFTYFLGRSHPNNLLNLLLPFCALGCLWASVFLGSQQSDRRPWRMVGVGLVLVVAATLVVLGVPGAQHRWSQTAFAQAVPFADGHMPGHGGASLRSSLGDLWAGRIADNSRVDHAARLLQRYDPGDGPALVVLPESTTEMIMDTTEVLLKVHRVNLLPISVPLQNDLISSHEWPRVVAAIDAMPDGTILVTSTRVAQIGPAPDAHGTHPLRRLAGAGERLTARRSNHRGLSDGI